MVTAGTYRKRKLFSGPDRLNALCTGLMKYALKHGSTLQAWAVFPNHYHFVAISPRDGGEGLARMLKELHSRSARWVNEQDGMTGRKVWGNYCESHLTFERSYLARLNYVHRNAVRHGLVMEARQYRWCSAGWFERNAPASFRKTVYGFPIDALKVDDDY